MNKPLGTIDPYAKYLGWFSNLIVVIFDGVENTEFILFWQVIMW